MGEWKNYELTEEAFEQVLELEDMISTYNEMESEKLIREVKELTVELEARGLSIPSFMQE